MNGTLYGVGVGPGDPELLTLKAVSLLGRADVVIVPRTKDRQQSHAYEISKKHISASCRVVYQVFPMNFNTEELKKAWHENAREIEEYLKSNETVVFLTIGDPMIYSTFTYIFEILKKGDAKIEIVPGVPSFCDAAARIKEPLCIGDEVLTIVPALNNTDRTGELLGSDDNLVLMKVYKYYDELLDALGENGRLESSSLAGKAGMADEVLIKNLSGTTKESINYLSTIISKKKR